MKGRSLLASPRFPDAETTRQAKALYTLLRLWVVVVTVYLAVLGSLFLPANRSRWVVTTFVVAAASLISLAACSVGRVRLASWLLIAHVWCVLSTLALTGGGVYAPAATGYLALIVAAGILLGQPAAIVTAAFSISAEAVFAVLGARDLLPRSAVQHTVYTVAAGHTLFAILFLILLDLSTRSIRDALHRAEHELERREQIEHALQESEERARYFVNAAFEGIGISENGRLVEVNEQLASLLGYDAAELIGRPVSDIVADEAVATVADRMSSASDQLYEHFALRRDGTKFPVEVRERNIRYRGREGRITAIRDLSERKQAEEALRKSEEKFSKVFMSAPTGIAVSTLEHGRILEVNREFEKLFGYTRDEVIGRTSVEIGVWGDAADREQLKEALSHEGPLRDREVQLYDKHRNLLTVRYSADFIELDGQNHVLSTFIDVTEQKRAEEALRRAEDLFRGIVQDQTEMIVRWKPDGTRTFVNQAYCRASRKSYHELVGSSFFPLLAPGYRQSLLAKIRTLTPASPVIEDVHERISENGEARWQEWTNRGLFDGQGKLIEIQSVGRDITERKRAEQQRRSLERQLIAAQKLESLGTLSGGIAHDFNNILAIILGHASLLESSVAKPPEFSPGLEAIVKAAQRGTALVQQLLTFARKSDVLFESVQLNSIVLEVVRLISQTFPKTIVVSTCLRPDIPAVRADSTQMHQVVLNLCVNARDAMPKGGTLTINTTAVFKETLVSKFPDAAAREYVEIDITDSGVGMDAATKRRMFEPFFTTKDFGKGTGLGLALVHSIVTNHDGFIDVETGLGIGTTFRILLPAHDEQPQIAAPPEDVQDVPGEGGTILLIEDEEMLADLVKTVLLQKGYAVLTAQNGEEGVEVFNRHQAEITAVICDMGLPKIAGDAVCRKIRAIDGSAKIVIASGYIDPMVKVELQNAGARHFVQKPYSPDELLRVLRETIAAK
jgi:PAS domain S-box-containing protein